MGGPVGMWDEGQGRSGGGNGDSTVLQDMFGSVIINRSEKTSKNRQLTWLDGQEDLQHQLQHPGWLSEKPFK